jgi:two-component system, NarL family, invasion response regulator UvrY
MVSAGSPVRVLVVDDHSGFRRALVATLTLVNGLQVVGEAGDGEAGCDAALALHPDVVLMDLSMPGISGVDSMRRIHRREPDIPVVILTAHADAALEREALGAGAAGFIAKGGGLQELVDSLLEVVGVKAGEVAGTA